MRDGRAGDGEEREGKIVASSAAGMVDILAEGEGEAVVSVERCGMGEEEVCTVGSMSKERRQRMERDREMRRGCAEPRVNVGLETEEKEVGEHGEARGFDIGIAFGVRFVG